MNREILAELVAAIDRWEPVALLTVTHGSGAYAVTLGDQCLVYAEQRHEPVGSLDLGELHAQVMADARAAIVSQQHRTLRYAASQGEIRIFVEVQAQPPHLVIVGAGHIAVPLTSIASLCDFRVTVLDDRPQYAHPDRFPNANNVIAGPFRTELQKLREVGPGFGARTYVVLVTRGHQHDVECLVELLDDPLAYIGMIGSQRRIRAVFELLESEQGILPDRLDRVFAPIGLDIGARTPAEIAVCIVAEIINVMRGGSAVSLSKQVRQERIARRARAQTRSSTG